MTGAGFSLFQPDRVRNVDPAYVHHRESQMKGDVRELIDSMYSEYKSYLGDPHFEDMIQTDFHAAVWQLYVGWSFLKQGSAPVVKASEEGPDVVLKDGTIIEAVIAKRGDGPDKPFSWDDERPSHENEYVKTYFPRAMAYPDPKIIMRITNAIAEKRRQYKKWIEDGVVKPNQPFIIAVNAGLIDEAKDAFGGSYGARVAFALGEDVFEVPVNLETGVADVDSAKSRIQHKPIVNKTSGADVQSNLFLSEGCSEVSALLFSPHYFGNVPLLGVLKDLELIPNGFACNKVRPDLLKGVRRTWAEVDHDEGEYRIQTDPPLRSQERTKNPIKVFFGLEAASGLILLALTLVAFAWANSPLRESYSSLWHLPVLGMSLHHWINDGLMAVFFFVVGLEIRREITNGELSSRKKAALPAAAALGGMIVPALIYAGFNLGQSSIRGWGIPMATDIAFAIGVLSLLGKRVPTSLKVFLTALAIVDDLGAVLVIALFYTEQISWLYLLSGIGLLAGLRILNRKGIQSMILYLLTGGIIWLSFLKSGVHATVAGVLLAMVVPSRLGSKLEHVLHPYVAFGVMPIFALANAGVTLGSASVTHAVSLGVIAGLVLGKQVGITLFAWLAVRFKLALLPRGIRWRQLYGVAWLGGIGFTMSLFIANLAFGDSAELDLAKLGILIASVVSAIGGGLLIAKASRSSLTT